MFIDECHATGFFGATGKGTDEYCGVRGRIDVCGGGGGGGVALTRRPSFPVAQIINSTLGKALGGASGGYTASSKQVVGILRQRARPYLFSNTICPPVVRAPRRQPAWGGGRHPTHSALPHAPQVGASLKVFELLQSTTDLVEQLQHNTHRFRTRMTEAGFTVLGNADHPIAPVYLGDARLASTFADKMLQRGIYVIGFSYPVRGGKKNACSLPLAHADHCLPAPSLRPDSRSCPRVAHASACSCRPRTRSSRSTVRWMRSSRSDGSSRWCSSLCSPPIVHASPPLPLRAALPATRLAAEHVVWAHGVLLFPPARATDGRQWANGRLAHPCTSSTPIR